MWDLHGPNLATFLGVWRSKSCLGGLHGPILATFSGVRVQKVESQKFLGVILHAGLPGSVWTSGSTPAKTRVDPGFQKNSKYCSKCSGNITTESASKSRPKKHLPDWKKLTEVSSYVQNTGRSSPTLSNSISWQVSDIWLRQISILDVTWHFGKLFSICKSLFWPTLRGGFNGDVTFSCRAVFWKVLIFLLKPGSTPGVQTGVRGRPRPR